MGRRGNRCRAPTTYRSIRQTVNGKAYRRFSLDIILEGAGNEDIFWYAPGPAADSVWDWYRGVLYKHNTSGEPLNGYFLTAPGDHLGDGSEEVVFENNNELWMREHILVAPGVVDVIDWIFLPEWRPAPRRPRTATLAACRSVRLTRSASPPCPAADPDGRQP